MYRKFIATAVLAAPLSILAINPASATQNHEDPCPGQHITVYNEESNVVLPHFVCAGDLKGAKGDKGDTGPAGVAGPAGPAGPQGPAGADGAAGKDGAASSVAGPAGPQGVPGADGATGAQGPEGPAGPAGVDGAAGPVGPAGDTGAAGPAGRAGKPGVTKTVIVHADGTTEVVPNLPKTGSHTAEDIGLIVGGIFLLGVGIAIVLKK